jgi:hypothetical protein
MNKDNEVFTVMGDTINLVPATTESGLLTVAEMNGKYHYLYDEAPSIYAAIFAWQEINDKFLTSEELKQVMLDNKLI